MAILGVDEAGKGPVLGPMVTAAVRVPTDHDLPPDIDDSKQLTATTRTTIAQTLTETPSITTATHHLTPTEIDNPTTNLNTLTVQAHTTVINDLAQPDDQIIVDASDVNATRFATRIANHLTYDLELISEHHADENYPVTAAASIIAKVERDNHIESLATTYGNLGSGYPSDQTTRDYLRTYYETHGEFPTFARTSWETCTTIKNTIDHPSLDDF